MVSSAETSDLVRDSLSEIAKEVLKRTKVSGVFLTGGDIAIGVFEKLGAMGSSICTEVTTGIPLMKLRGGDFDGMRVITKAGAFGKDDLIVYSLRKLKEVL